jgi:predicted MPP superfamily phosphohydrolase
MAPTWNLLFVGLRGKLILHFTNPLMVALLHAPPHLSSGPRVFVTSGLGETALPFRLFNPPVIDLLTLK